MADMEVLVIGDIDQTAVVSQVVGLDHALGFYFASYERLQGGFGAGRHNFAVDLAIVFVEPEGDLLARSNAIALSMDEAYPEKPFIDFDLPGERGLLFGILGQPFADRTRETAHSVSVQVDQLGDLVASKSMLKGFVNSRNLALKILEPLL